MSITARGFAACEKPERYIQQLISHWSHKLTTSFTDATGKVSFSDDDEAQMTVAPGGIEITLTTGDAERNVQMRQVIEKHIDRFAFREGALAYVWTDQ